MKRIRINWARLCLMTGLVICIVLGTVFGLTRAATPPPPSRTVRVAAGDTLWGIAQEHGPARVDLRRLTFDLEQLNALQGVMLQPGMVLTLPAGWN